VTGLWPHKGVYLKHPERSLSVCQFPVKILDVNTGRSEVSARFREYTDRINRDFLTAVNRFYRIPNGVVEMMARYPESLQCIGKGPSMK
jgi:hypothetical protein